MRIVKLPLVLLIIALGCSGQIRETPKGYEYTVLGEGDGIPIQPGQFLKMSLIILDANDSVITDTRVDEIPMIMPIPDVSAMVDEEGIEEIIRMLSLGDSITAKIPVRLLYEHSMQQPVPPTIDAESDFTFFIKVDAVLDSTQVIALQEELFQRERTRIDKEEAEQLGKDAVIIEEYLASKNISAQKTDSGIWFIVTKQGQGPTARAGQSVSLNYSGYLLDGTYFDSSIESVAREKNMYTEGRVYGPYQFILGQGRVIQGWDEIIQQMNTGMKITAYIPSSLAYGSMRRSEVIVENSILVFDMELTAVR